MTSRGRALTETVALALGAAAWAWGAQLRAVAGRSAGLGLPDAGWRSAAEAWRLGIPLRDLLPAAFWTTDAGWPVGGRVFLPAEAWLPLEWSQLLVVRASVAVVGAAMLLRRAEAPAAWGLLVAAPVVAGAVGPMAWAPLGAALLLCGGVRYGVLGGLALAQGADVSLAGLALAWGVARSGGQGMRSPSWGAALGVVVAALAFEAWAGMAAVDAWMATGWTGWGVRAEQARATVGGIVGFGERVWAGAPLLVLMALTAWGARRDPRARDALALSVAGSLLALGPHLSYASGPVVLAGRGVPLPALALAWLPPLRAAATWEGWCILAWVGGVIGAGRALASAPPWGRALAGGSVLLAANLVQSGGWRTAPALPSSGRGDVVLDVVSSGARDVALLDAQRHGARSVARPGGGGFPDDVRDVVERPATLARWQEGLRRAGVTHVRVADESTAQTTALRWLLGADLRAVAGTAWPEVTVTPDAREVAGVRSVLWRYRGAQGRDADWERVDEGLAVYLDPAYASDALVQVRLYTSDDAERWVAGPVVAHSLSSLGLTTVGDEALVVTATAFPTARVRRVSSGTDVAPVLLLTTRDLQRWGMRGVLVDPPLALVDPQVDRVGDGWELTAWTHFGAWGQDPAEVPGERALVRGASADGIVFTLTPAGTAPGLADPTVRDGVMHATHVSPGAPLRAQAWALGSDPRSLLLDVPEASVPFPWSDGARARVLMQAPRGEVWEVRREETGAWSVPRVVEGIPDAPRCESPVAARFRGRFVLLCSERLQEGIAHASHEGAR